MSLFGWYTAFQHRTARSRSFLRHKCARIACIALAIGILGSCCYTLSVNVWLSSAIKDNDIEMARFALQLGADPRARYLDVQFLLREPRDLLEPRSCPLVCVATLRAYQTHRVDILEALLRAGADPNARDADDRYPLQYDLVMETQPDLNIVRLLIKYGAKPSGSREESLARRAVNLVKP
jgi:hypothetical protein